MENKTEINIEDIKNKIKTTLNNHHTIHLYLVLKVEDKFVLRLSDLDNGSTTTEMLTMFEGFLQKNILASNEAKIRNLSSAEETANTIYKYDYTELPVELQQFANFNFDDKSNIDYFNLNNENLNQLFGYIIRIGNDKDEVLLFKRHFPIFLIKEDSFLLRCINNISRFKKLDKNDILRINGDAQFLRLNNSIFVLNLKTLEQFPSFTKLIEKSAKESIDAIKNLDILDDIEALEDALTDLHFLRKISKIKESSLVFKLGINKETILQFTKTNPELSGKFKYNSTGDKIALSTKKSKELFLKLINDSFLHSKLTKQWYVTTAKDQITRSSE